MSDQFSEYLSEEGFAKVKAELAGLSGARRQEIAAALESAKSLGDLSENSEYQDAKESQAANEARIAELGYLLQRAVVVSQHSLEVVGVGAKIITQHMGTGSEYEFIIVGPEESDPAVFKISYESPIGHALMGKRKGEEAKVTTPKGQITYKILKIV